MKYRKSLSGKYETIFKLRFFWSRYPWLFYQYYSRIAHPTRTLTKETDLLIEGFGRSGSSFTRDSFYLLNNKKIKIAWNQKSPSAVAEAVKWKKPILILIREPKEVALSYKIMNENLSFELILDQYIRYYKSIWKYKKNFVIAQNDQVWKNINNCIHQLNTKFTTKFQFSEDLQDNMDNVKKYEEEDYNEKYSKKWDESIKRTVNYPTLYKNKKKKLIEKIFDELNCNQLKKDSKDWYDNYIENV